MFKWRIHVTYDNKVLFLWMYADSIEIIEDNTVLIDKKITTQYMGCKLVKVENLSK